MSIEIKKDKISTGQRYIIAGKLTGNDQNACVKASDISGMFYDSQAKNLSFYYHAKAFHSTVATINKYIPTYSAASGISIDASSTTISPLMLSIDSTLKDRKSVV